MDSKEDSDTGADDPDVVQARRDGGAEARETAAKSRVSIENLGGIDELEVAVPAGVSLLVGRNATNRSSFLRSLAAVLGGERTAARLKSDADSGEVSLTVEGESHHRTYSRTGEAVTRSGSPHTDSAELVDTFVALFAECPARSAVESGADLREVLMTPVDTEAINRQIAELTDRRSELDETIQQAKQRKAELPGLKQQRAQLEAELEEIETAIDSREATIAELDDASEQSDEVSELQSELSTVRAEYTETQQRLTELSDELEFRREERESLRAERAELAGELDEYEDQTALRERLDSLERDRDRLTERRRTLEQVTEDLQSAIRANETFLEGELESTGLTNGDGVADALDPSSQTVECWTCGTAVEREQIRSQLDALQDIVTQQRSELSEVETQIADIEAERESCERRLEQYRKQSQEVEEIDRRIEQHGDRIEQLEAEREQVSDELDQLDERLATLESELESVESDTEETDSEEFVEVHTELTALERERGQTEARLQDTVDTIDQVETLAQRQARAEETRAEVTEELNTLRGRIEEIEAELVETLNTVMSDLLERLEYGTLTRVWVEQRRPDAETSTFDLHIVREAEDGTVYEDTVDTLSESEREIIGLVVSLAGYLVHDIDQRLPFLLLDSVEMIDGERLAALIEYVMAETEVQFFCAALLPKDARSVKMAPTLEDPSVIEFDGTPQ